jgi:uncharacterized protein
MGKILFWAMVIIGVLFLTRLLAHYAANRQSGQGDKNTSGTKQAKSNQTETLGKPEDMVRCASCGVYLPQSDAIKQNEQFWCSEEHAKSETKTRP